MDKRLTIFSLAERDAFINAVWNYLGWAPEATRGLHGRPLVKRPVMDYTELTVNKLKESGTVLVIKHLFEPFKKPEPDFYIRQYYDDSFHLLRLLLSKGVPFILDIEDKDAFDKEKDLLLSCSPPLYNKLFGKGHTPAKKQQTMKYDIIITSPDGTTATTDTAATMLGALTALRSEAFSLAASGKHGKYPLTSDEFNQSVEEGFSDDGSAWEAEDGTSLLISEKRYVHHHQEG